MSTCKSSLVAVSINAAIDLGAYNARFSGPDAIDKNGMCFLDEVFRERLVMLYESGDDVLECRRMLHHFAPIAYEGFIAGMHASGYVIL